MLSDAEKELMMLKDLLNSTDWYIIRKLEKGIEVPKEITQARDAARQQINKIEIK